MKKNNNLKLVLTKGKSTISMTPEEAREVFNQLKPMFEPILASPLNPIFVPYLVPHIEVPASPYPYSTIFC